ncbi:transporter substrate-binding domain-containing protein [Campylobacter ureolyticus]|uniref:transporter substrate-binding domain-containing protein n=1 Tax=Campylobacter ureolyticus TaxID=827 RepID=UPI0026ED5781|nr:transporter substrate-binding domain-containing protein [Campylobacter ureolyticus]
MKRIFFIILFGFCVLFARDLEEIKSSNEIKIGVRTDFPPFSQIKDGEFTGFEVELAKAIGNKILDNKGKVVLVGVEAKDRIPMLKNDQIDLMVANFTMTDERKKAVDFSFPYLLDFMGILAPSNSHLNKLSSFNGKKLLVIPGTTSDEFLKDNKTKFKNIEVVSCENLYDCLTKLKNNEGDGYFHTVFSLANIAVIDNTFTITNKAVGHPDYIACGIKKGNSSLLNAVNNAIVKLSKENFFTKAYDETFKIHYKGTIDKKYFLVDDIYRVFG